MAMAGRGEVGAGGGRGSGDVGIAVVAASPLASEEGSPMEGLGGRRGAGRYTASRASFSRFGASPPVPITPALPTTGLPRGTGVWETLVGERCRETAGTERCRETDRDTQH